jgi:hypothetical protein
MIILTEILIVDFERVTATSNLFTDIILHIQLAPQLGYRLNDWGIWVRFQAFHLSLKELAFTEAHVIRVYGYTFLWIFNISSFDIS